MATPINDAGAADAADDGAGAAAEVKPVTMEEAEVQAISGYWHCPVCTYSNDLGAQACQMCETARGTRGGCGLGGRETLWVACQVSSSSAGGAPPSGPCVRVWFASL